MERIGRALIIRPGAIGDFIVSLPALESISARYVEVWTHERNVPLARFAGAARSIGSTGLNLLGLPDCEPSPLLLDRLRSFDAIYSWYGTSRPEFRAAVSSLPFRFFDALVRPASACHATDFYWRQVGNRGACPPPRIDCGNPPREDFAILHPFASSPAKRWPLENYRTLAGRIETRMPVHFCAGPDEVFEGAVRYDNLFDLACWIARARIYVGNDSGITHLAAATGTPTIALFGPSDAAVWAPRGAGVTVLANFDGVTVPEVAEAVQNCSSS